MKLLQWSVNFKQRSNYEVPFEYNFCMKFLTNPNSKKKKLAILCIAAVEKPNNLISKFQFHFFSLKDAKFLDKSISDKNKGSESTWMQVKLVYQNSYWLDIKTVIESFTTSFEGGILWWSDLVLIIYLKLFNRTTFET